jgi:hypothetical protein
MDDFEFAKEVFLNDHHAPALRFPRVYQKHANDSSIIPFVQQAFGLYLTPIEMVLIF